MPPDEPVPTRTWPEPDWKPLLTATRLDAATLVAADPLWTPPVATRSPSRVDERRSPNRGGRVPRPRRLVLVVPSWWLTREGTVPPPAGAPNPIGPLVQGALTVIGIVAGVLLARRNLMLGRSDRRGASRFAAVFVALGFVAQLLTFTSVSGSFAHMMTTLGLQLFSGALVWIFYVALEPYVRRLWPDTLTAWTPRPRRPVPGSAGGPPHPHRRDGRHRLHGTLPFAHDWRPLARNGPPEPHGAAGALPGARFALSEFLFILQGSIFLPVVVLLCMLVLRVILRRPPFVYAAIVVLALMMSPMRTGWDAATLVIVAALVVVVLTRLGVLAFVVAIDFSTWEHIPLTMDSNSWFFPWSVMTMALFAAVAVYGFVVSLGGKLRFTAAGLEE